MTTSNSLTSDRQASHGKKTRGGATPLYTAPEQFGSSFAFTDKADIFSIGVIVYILLTGLPPFTANDKRKTREHLALAFEKKEFACRSPQARSFTKSLMNIDPEMRPSAKDALGDPWISYSTKKPDVDSSCSSMCFTMLARVHQITRFKKQKTNQRLVDNARGECAAMTCSSPPHSGLQRASRHDVDNSKSSSMRYLILAARRVYDKFADAVNP